MTVLIIFVKCWISMSFSNIVFFKNDNIYGNLDIKSNQFIISFLLPRYETVIWLFTSMLSYLLFFSPQCPSSITSDLIIYAHIYMLIYVDITWYTWLYQYSSLRGFNLRKNGTPPFMEIHVPGCFLSLLFVV